MKKYLRYISYFVIFLALAGSAALGGMRVAESQNAKNPQAPAETQKPQQAEVYFYRTDGIYSMSSEDPTPKKIVETQFNSEKYYFFNSKFELMGPNKEWLVYRDMAGLHEQTGEVQFDLIVYDMKNKKPVLTVHENEGSVTSFLVSPSGKNLVYVMNSYETPKEVGEGAAPFVQNLYFWDGSITKPHFILSEKSGFFSLVLGVWLDEERLTLGRGYEGVSFCALNITTENTLPENCQGYGSSSMGTVDLIRTVQNDMLYGYHYEWEEITGQTRSTRGIFEQKENEERRFITSDVPTDLVVGQDTLYYLRNGQDGSKYTWNGGESDLYSVSKNGETLKRLTNDGTSISAKSNLFLSDDGRFLAYQKTDLSQISPDKNTLEEQANHTGIWLYDIKLNKYYEVAEKGLSPKVIVRNIPEKE